MKGWLALPALDQRMDARGGRTALPALLADAIDTIGDTTMRAAARHLFPDSNSWSMRWQRRSRRSPNRFAPDAPDRSDAKCWPAGCLDDATFRTERSEVAGSASDAHSLPPTSPRRNVVR